MNLCCGCGKPVRWYHATGMNSSWHKACSEAWMEGYNCACSFANDMNSRMGYPTIMQIYEIVSQKIKLI